MLITKIIKEEFSFLDGVTFLNIASVAMPPISVQKAFAGYMQNYVHNFGQNVIPDSWEMVEETRDKIAKLINCEASEIGFVKNTTEGMGIIANGLKFSNNENVVIVDQEHSATLFAWIDAQKRGLKLHVVSSSKTDISLEKIIEKIDSKTKAVIISSVQFASGIKSDIKKLGEICSQKGVLLIVDAIQSVGRMKMDVQEMNIDYLVCGGHKGLLATVGVGFVYCKDSLIKDVSPPYACYQSVKTRKDPGLSKNFDYLDWHDDARRFESGNLNYPGIAAINAGVTLINRIGIDNIEQHILKLEKEMINALLEKGYDVKPPCDEEKRSGIFCLYYDMDNEQAIKESFKAHKVFATFRDGYIRVSINFYNTLKDIDRLIEALDVAHK